MTGTPNQPPKRLFNPWRYTAVMFVASVIFPAANVLSVLFFETLLSNPYTDYIPTVVASFIEGLRGAKQAIISTARKIWAASFFMALISLGFGLVLMSVHQFLLTRYGGMQFGMETTEWLKYVLLSLVISFILARLCFGLGVHWENRKDDTKGSTP